MSWRARVYLSLLFSLDHQTIEPLGDINLAGLNTRPGHRRDFFQLFSGRRNQVVQIDTQPLNPAREVARVLKGYWPRNVINRDVTPKKPLKKEA